MIEKLTSVTWSGPKEKEGVKEQKNRRNEGSNCQKWGEKNEGEKEMRKEMEP